MTPAKHTEHVDYQTDRFAPARVFHRSLYRAFLLFSISLFACGQASDPGKDEDLRVRIFLVKRMNPGNCEGMPMGLDESFIRRTLSENANLVERIKKDFAVTENIQLYNKVLQIQRIVLNKEAGGYRFTLRDGKCCNVVVYRGTVRVAGDSFDVNVESETKETLPC